MRTNPGRRNRRIMRRGRRLPTRMSEYARHRQAEVDRFDGMLCRIGVRVDAEIVPDDELDGQGGDADDDAVEYPGGHVPAAGVREVTAYERAVLGALQHKATYQGSVHADVVAGRRRRNRAARAARRVSRTAAVAAVLMVCGAAAGLQSAAPAHALDVTRQVTVSIGWDDDTACVSVVEPDAAAGRAVLTGGVSCAAAHGVTITYLSRPGQWYGARMVSAGSGLACQVKFGDLVVDFKNAMDTVDCLGRW